MAERHKPFLVTIAIGVLTLLSLSDLYAQTWEVPKEVDNVTNPLPLTEEVFTIGAKIYLKKCGACHGEKGDGDGPDGKDLVIDPPALHGSDIQKQTDGALFWKIKVGRRPMPKYGSRLTDEEIWSLVHYMRGLNGK